MRRLSILLDSDGIIAVLNGDNPNHKLALRLQKKLDKQRVAWYVSRYVVAEVATVVSQRVNHRIAVEFLKNVSKSEETYLIETSEELEGETRKIFEEQTSKNVSYIDCHNVALARWYKLDGIFSFDKHYKKNGIRLVTE